MARKKKQQVVAPPKVEAALPPPPPVTDPVLLSYREDLYRQGQAYWDEEAEQYGWDDPEQPENVVRRLQGILGARTREEASQALLKARGTIQVMILGAWARGRIPGPTTEQSVERRVKRAESLASMLEKKGQLEAAERQWARASQLRIQLEEIREASAG